VDRWQVTRKSSLMSAAVFNQSEIESPLRAQFMLKNCAARLPQHSIALLDRAAMLECEGIRDDLFAFVS
jgi:hypothetical protein